MSDREFLRRHKFAIILGLAFLAVLTASPYFIDSIPFIADHQEKLLPLGICAPFIGSSIGEWIDRQLANDEPDDSSEAT